MNAVFADTGFWIALLNPIDELHEKALALSKTIVARGQAVMTSEMVFTDLLNHFAKFSPTQRRAAITLIEQMTQHPQLVIAPQTSEQFSQAMQLYAQRADKPWSLTDCASFLIMQQHGIMDALAYDRHFIQAGFRALLRDP